MGGNTSKVEETPEKPRKVDFQRLFPPRQSDRVTAGKGRDSKAEKTKQVCSTGTAEACLDRLWTSIRHIQILISAARILAEHIITRAICTIRKHANKLAMCAGLVPRSICSSVLVRGLCGLQTYSKLEEGLRKDDA